MPYNLPQAAAAVARDRSTILRSIKAGKLSATRDSATNGWLIEPSELFRVYRAQPGTQADSQPHTADATTATAVLEAKLTAEREKVALLERALDDMRRRLDAEADERRRLTAIIADGRQGDSARRRWWQFGRG